MTELMATLVLKPLVKVVSAPGEEGLGKLLTRLIEAAKSQDFQERVRTMEEVQTELIRAGLPEGVVADLSREILEACSGNKARINRLPTVHRLSRRSA